MQTNTVKMLTFGAAISVAATVAVMGLSQLSNPSPESVFLTGQSGGNQYRVRSTLHDTYTLGQVTTNQGFRWTESIGTAQPILVVDDAVTGDRVDVYTVVTRHAISPSGPDYMLLARKALR